MSAIPVLVAVGAMMLLGGRVWFARDADAGPAVWLAASGVVALAAGGVFALTRGSAPDATIAGCLALGAAVLGLVPLRFRDAANAGWPGVLAAVVGLGPAIACIWLLAASPRAGLDVLPDAVSGWLAASSTSLAGGLGFVLYATVLASDDDDLRSASWLALGLTLTIGAAAVYIGASTPIGGGAYLPVVDGAGVPVEVRAPVTIGENQVRWLAVPLVLVEGATGLGTLLIVVAGLCLAAGIAGSYRASAGRVVFGMAAVAGIVAIATLVDRVGAVAQPSSDALVEILTASGVPDEMLAGAPTTSVAIEASSQYFVHRGDVLPHLVVLWVVVAVAGWRALAPRSGARASLETTRFQPGSALSASRDAVLLGTLLLWLGVGLGWQASSTGFARVVTGSGAAGPVAIAVVCSAALTGWHAALGRQSRVAFGVWLALPALVLAIAALVFVGGQLGDEPFSWWLSSLE